MTSQWVTCTVHCASVIGLDTDFPLVGVPAGHAVELVSHGHAFCLLRGIMPTLYHVTVICNSSSKPCNDSLQWAGQI